MFFGSDVTILGDDDFTDEREARGFTETQGRVDIYSCSYGPGDNGYTLGTMGYLTKEAIRRSAMNVSS